MAADARHGQAQMARPIFPCVNALIPAADAPPVLRGRERGHDMDVMVPHVALHVIGRAPQHVAPVALLGIRVAVDIPPLPPPVLAQQCLDRARGQIVVGVQRQNELPACGRECSVARVRWAAPLAIARQDGHARHRRHIGPAVAGDDVLAQVRQALPLHAGRRCARVLSVARAAWGDD